MVKFISPFHNVKYFDLWDRYKHETTTHVWYHEDFDGLMLFKIKGQGHGQIYIHLIMSNISTCGTGRNMKRSPIAMFGIMWILMG